MYGGTKEEMERLVKDAAKIDKSIDANSLSYANVVKAIHAVQENMGITGTTAKEAEKTITGSLNAMKSSWGNLLTAMASGENIDQCIDNMVSSVETFAGNVMPIIEKALGGLGSVVEKIVPKITEKLPGMVEKFIPPLISAAVALVGGLLATVPQIMGTLLDAVEQNGPRLINEIVNGLNQGMQAMTGMMPRFVTIGVQLLNSLISGLSQTLPTLIPLIVDGLNQVTQGILGMLPDFIAIGVQLLNSLILGIGQALPTLIPSIVQALLEAVNELINHASAFVDAGIQCIQGLIDGVLAGIPLLLQMLPEIVQNGVNVITKSLPMLIDAGVQIINKLVNGLVQNLPAIIDAALRMVNALVDGIIKNLNVIINGAMSVINALVGGLIKNLPKIIQAAMQLIDGLCRGLIQNLPTLVRAAISLVLSLANSLIDNIGMLISAALQLIIGIAQGLLNNLGVIIQAAIEIMVALAGGLIQAIPTLLSAIPEVFGALWNAITSINWIDLGKSIIKGIWEGIKGLGSGLWNGIKGLFTGGKDGGSLENEGSSAGQSYTSALTSNLNTESITAATSNISSGLNMDLTSTGATVGQSYTSGLTGSLNTEGLSAVTSNISNSLNMDLTSTGATVGQSYTSGLTGSLNTEGLSAVTSNISNSLNVDLTSTGASVGQSYTSGLTSGLNTEGLSAVTSNISNSLNVDLSSTGIETASTYTNGLTTGLSETTADVQNFTENTSSQITDLQTVIAKTMTAIGKDVKANIDKTVEEISKLPQQMGDGIKKAGHSLAESLVYIWQEAAKAMSTPVNKIIEGANWILGEFGSDKKIASWTPYARGTSGHKGGNALVNDGRGAELVQMPNGRTFIPQGRNVFLPAAPKGMKVLPAEQTARLMGRKSPTFRYAKGTGDIDIWNYLDDSKGLVNAVSDKYVSYDGMSGYALAAGKGMVNTIKGAMESWTKKLFDEFGAKSLADYVASAGVEQWRSTVIRALKMENQYSAANVERTLYQMQTESGGNPKAINLWDSNAKAGIPSKGLMQVIDPTFQAYARAGFNSNIYDPLSNILASIRYAVSRYGSLGKAYQGHGYAKGVGTVDLSAYTPESSSSTVINSRNKETIENNSFSPTFNLSISGTTDDRVMARKVQRWVKEAINEMYESMNRKNPATIKI